MLKVMAIVRSLFLVFIIGFTGRAMPWFSTVPKTFDEQYARCSTSVGLLSRAAWLAVAWIALETLVGWLMTLRRARNKAAETATASSRP